MPLEDITREAFLFGILDTYPKQYAAMFDLTGVIIPVLFSHPARKQCANHQCRHANDAKDGHRGHCSCACCGHGCQRDIGRNKENTARNRAFQFADRLFRNESRARRIRIIFKFSGTPVAPAKFFFQIVLASQHAKIIAAEPRHAQIIDSPLKRFKTVKDDNRFRNFDDSGVSVCQSSSSCPPETGPSC